MFKNIKLISLDESEDLYLKQEKLLCEIKKAYSTETLIRIALLQTLPPIDDYYTAVNILKEFMSDDYNFLIIGAYLSTRCLDLKDNIFLEKLLLKKDCTNQQISLIKYLQAVVLDNKTSDIPSGKEDSVTKIKELLSESIDLCDEYVSNFYFRYLQTKNGEDYKMAKRNVKKIWKEEEVMNASINSLIAPSLFINEKIKMTFLVEETYDSLFMGK